MRGIARRALLEWFVEVFDNSIAHGKGVLPTPARVEFESKIGVPQ